MGTIKQDTDNNLAGLGWSAILSAMSDGHDKSIESANEFMDADTFLNVITNQRSVIGPFTIDLIAGKVNVDVLVRAVRSKVIVLVNLIDNYINLSNLTSASGWWHASLKDKVMSFVLAYLAKEAAAGDVEKKALYQMYINKGYRMSDSSDLISEIDKVWLTLNNSYNEIAKAGVGENPDSIQIKSAFLNYFSDMTLFVSKAKMFVWEQQQKPPQFRDQAKQQLDKARVIIREEEAPAFEDDGEALLAFSNR